MALSKYDIELDVANNPNTSHALMIDLIGANKRVLDVGCDTGYLGEELATLGNRTWGVEYNPQTAAEAEKRLERVVVADLENVDLLAEFGPGSFDVVVFGDVLEHLRDPIPILRAARPLLAPGGSVVISTPNVAHGDVRLALLQGQFRYTKVGILDVTHTRFFTRDTLVEFLHDAGFVLAELRRTTTDLFTTEVGVQPEDFDPELIARLREDPESTTYQFVLRAVPDDATAVESIVAIKLDEAERAVIALTAKLDALQQQLETLGGERDGIRQQRDDAVAEVAALRNSKVFRYTAGLRNVYARVRAARH